MKITYIHHSCFLVELEEHVLLFDYFTGRIPALPQGKKTYVFHSHRHPDHFKPKTFELLQTCPEAHYFLSDDIRTSDAWFHRIGMAQLHAQDVVTMVHAHSPVDYEAMHLDALISNDEGVAFLLSLEGKEIYFAGDLNWWYWDGEPDEENDDLTRRYLTELERIRGRHFDVAFVPLDPRLERTAGWGMDLFLQYCDADVIFPMHQWDDYALTKTYKKETYGTAPDVDKEVIGKKTAYIQTIAQDGDVFTI